MVISELTVFHRSATENEINDAKKVLKEIKIQSPDKIIFGHLNINLVRSKFEPLIYTIDNKIYVHLISETKLDDSFPIAQFQMKGFSIRYRYGRNGKGSGRLLYIREYIQSRLLISIEMLH